MSAAPIDEERDLLAAEYALGLLDGEAMRRARLLAAADEDFAGAVARWQELLAPLIEEIGEEQPGPELWERIQRAIAEAPATGANVVGLRTLRLWKTYAAGITAVAASLALLVGYEATRQAPPAMQAERPRVMIATLSSEQEEASLSVAYDGEQASLLVTPGRLTAASGHDHELWIIPAGGSPVSLGLVRAGAPQRIAVPTHVAPHFRARAAIAVSVEPVGGSPTRQPTGPVIAAGELVIV